MRASSAKPCGKRSALPVTDLDFLGLPLALNQQRYERAVSEEHSSGACFPNKLLPVSQLHWTQDSAWDSFSKGESLWQTLLEVISGSLTIYLSSNSNCLPTLQVAKYGDHWYSEGTRRLLVYKIAFHPDQLIPVFDMGNPRTILKKLGSKIAGQQDISQGGIRLKVRLHDMVPSGLNKFPFFKDLHYLCAADLARARAASRAKSQSSIQQKATPQITHRNVAGSSQLAKIGGKKDMLLTLLADMKQLQIFDGSHLAVVQQRQEVVDCLSEMFSVACEMGMQVDGRLRRLSDELRNLLNPAMFVKLSNSDLTTYISKLECSPVWSDCDDCCQLMLPVEDAAAAAARSVRFRVTHVKVDSDVQECTADLAHGGTDARQKSQKGRTPKDTHQRQQRTKALLSSPSVIPVQAILHSDSGWEREIRNQLILKAKSRQKKHDKELLQKYFREGLLSAADQAWLKETPWFAHASK